MHAEAAQGSDPSLESSAFLFLKRKHSDRFRFHLSAPRYDLKGHDEFCISAPNFPFNL